MFLMKKSKLKGFLYRFNRKTELLAIMRSTLPVFMIPGMIRQIEEMPLTKTAR